MSRELIKLTGRTATHAICLMLLCVAWASAADSPEPKVWFGNLKNGDKVSSPLHVEMKVSGMKVAPAGTMDEGTGHHHIVIDGQPIAKGSLIPADEKHLHFGQGQTEADLTLSSGKHTLTLQFADGLHRSYGPLLAQSIEVEVVGGK